MPGVIMGNGSRNGSHTNHDRDQRPNGINGGNYGLEKPLEKGKSRAEPEQNRTPISPTAPNGLNGDFLGGQRHQNGGDNSISKDIAALVEQLPPELVHITTNFVPLSTLLTRLAQKTHNDLSTTILELAQMPLPASVTSGNGSNSMTTDDNSMENVGKKLRLLKFAQNSHKDWTKALVITNWSRMIEDISKVIDINWFLVTKLECFPQLVHKLTEHAYFMSHARLPSPDLKTAIEVLTTGKASWMPELEYIVKPPLTAKEVLKALENINTLLSIRLNLHDYDKIPLQFRGFTINSGRATFKVPGEFLVDLTIADEDQEKQFWFIDFKFLFSPSLTDVSLHLRAHIETRVNEALRKDGLAGCYDLLHGMVLTHKISEFKRQAVSLARGKWVEVLKVEPLNRSLSIQYWLDRNGRKSPKSWIIIGVHSGKRKTGVPRPGDTSHLSIRWFRESKEVKDVEISLNSVNISAESLLKTIIAKHVNYILTSMYEKLREKPLFANNEADLELITSANEPGESELKVQLTNERTLSVRIDPFTGRFVLSPASRLIIESEFRINVKCTDPATEGHTFIETIRQNAITEDIVCRGLSVGWIRVDNPGLNKDDLRAVVSKETSFVLWLRRPGWIKNWYIAVSMGMSGERWWLIETSDPPSDTHNAPGSKNAKRDTNLKIVGSLPVPIKTASPVPTYAFLSTVQIFAAALISHYSNLKSLHKRRSPSLLYPSKKISATVKLPSIYVRLSDLLHLGNGGLSMRDRNVRSKRDMIKITFQGLEGYTPTAEDIQKRIEDLRKRTASPQQQNAGPQPPNGQQLQPPDEHIIMITEARMILSVPVPDALRNIKEKIDRDIAFDCNSGSFAFRLRSKIGEAVIPSLIERGLRMNRLVDFVTVLQQHANALKCESISLEKITFTYGNASSSNRDAMDLDLALPREYKATIDFSSNESHISLVLEPGNPHLEISDHLTRILNGNQGLGGVATLLPLTLPVLRGLDSIKTAWVSVSNAEVFVNIRSTDTYVTRYDLRTTTWANSALENRPSKVMFEIRLRSRRGVPWWHIRRTDSRKDSDDLDVLLKAVWNESGDGWEGMRSSGVAQASGIEDLLGKIDDVVRKYVIDGQATGAMSGEPTTTNSAQTQQIQQQVRQQPTPNQSQSQSQNQGRNNPIKHEIVEID